MTGSRKRALFGGLFLFVILGAPLMGQTDEGRIFSYIPGERFSITERHDIRLRKNGTYQGFITREIRYLVHPDLSVPDGYIGTAYRIEEMKNRGMSIALPVDETVAISFVMLPSGEYRLPARQAYPMLQSFPRFSTDPVAAGEKWQSTGVRVVDPRNDGVFTRIRFLCEYQYLGEKTEGDTTAHLFRAQYATRYRPGDDPYGDPGLKSVSGKHVIDITYYEDRGSFFMRDTIDEQYQYADGTLLTFQGFILTWINDVVPLERENIVKKITEELQENAIPDVEVTETAEGVMISLQNIHFVPDKAEILPEEMPRLDILYRALSGIEGRTFLVVGHTAAVGTEESQYRLSVERARRVIAELVARGMEPIRFIYQGRGGREPLASNDTEEGRAKNRRVEIIILED